MITATLIFLLFAAGAALFSVGTGIVAFGLKVVGHVVKLAFSVLGFLLMPFAAILAVAFGVGYLLPIVVPIALIVFVVALVTPRGAA